MREPSPPWDLETLHTRVRACTTCEDAGLLPDAKPVVWGHEDQRLMLVGQSPGSRAHATGVPWSGVSGDILKRWFAEAGFPADLFRETWYFTSVTKCFPGKAVGGKGDRSPSVAERRSCRPWLDAEISLVQPELVVTLGKLAADTLIPGASRQSLGALVGSVQEVDLGYGAVPVIPLPHPSGVSRWLNDPANQERVEAGLAHLCRLRQHLSL